MDTSCPHLKNWYGCGDTLGPSCSKSQDRDRLGPGHHHLKNWNVYKAAQAALQAGMQTGTGAGTGWALATLTQVHPQWVQWKAGSKSHCQQEQAERHVLMHAQSSR